MNIIGIVGPLACGKSVVSKYFIKKYGYVSFSLSSVVHDELRERGITNFTRTTLQDIGDELRKKEGGGVLAKRAMDKIQAPHFAEATRGKQNSKKVIIEGIRNPGEVSYLRTIPGFFLIAVDAPQEVRFERMLIRGKVWDPKDWETFLQIDGRDQGDKNNRSGQHVRACMKLADLQLQNTTNLTQFYEAIEKAFLSRRPLHTDE